jgi:hypothetical protein
MGRPTRRFEHHQCVSSEIKAQTIVLGKSQHISTRIPTISTINLPRAWLTLPSREDKAMRDIRHFFAVMFAVAAIAGPARSEEFGTIAEARLMLERAVVEVGIDKGRAFEMFNGNHPKFRDRDLFVFCFRTEDGKFTAHEALVTHDVRQLRDQAGLPLGARMFTEAREGMVSEIRYVSPFPGTTSLVPKRAFVTRVDNHVCGVSAYLYNGPGGPVE